MTIQDFLHIDTNAVRQAVTSFIRTEIARAGMSHAVLGLSGGIDSAVVCYLAAEALGPKNVLAITLPYASSSPQSLADAQAVIGALGVQHEHVEITPMVDPLFACLPDMDQRRRGNAMARMRMIVWYDRSEAFHGLVLGGGNKTESLLGYSTLYGDTGCALLPIGDLYKTQVRQLAAAIGVPQSIQTKAPTADLWQGQTDEGEMGITYEMADCILFQLFERNLTPQQVVEAGYAPENVRRICRMVQRSQYKRALPAVAKISCCTLGYEMPIGRVAPNWCLP